MLCSPSQSTIILFDELVDKNATLIIARLSSRIHKVLHVEFCS